MISARYDDNSDILYVQENASPAYGDEIPDGLLVRYAYDSGRPCGVTVFDFDYRWHKRCDELVNKIASVLSAKAADVERAIIKARRA